MLAIKTIILAYSSIETIIFDEVDTGVSGKVASSIGDKMLQLAQNKQVICITHLQMCIRDSFSIWGFWTISTLCSNNSTGWYRKPLSAIWSTKKKIGKRGTLWSKV